MLALTLTPNLGPKRIVDAIAQLETPGAAQFIFEGNHVAQRTRNGRRSRNKVRRSSRLQCPEYPEWLKESYNPPPVLWVRKVVRLLSRPSIAVVGTRHPSPYGASVAEMRSRDLAARRFVTVSGMARGIDTCAHQGALAARTSTVADLGDRDRRGLCQGEQETRR